MSLFNFLKKTPDTPAPHERFAGHLDQIFQMEPRLFKEESSLEGIPGVTVFVYENVPEPGCITAVTYGLSLVEHPDWKHGRPELCISVESTDVTWGKAIAFLANQLRSKFAFSYGQMVNFHEKISLDSEMDAFFVFAPSILEKEDYLNIDIGTKYNINIAGIYPMYSEEMELMQQIGLEAFWHHPEFDNFSIRRKPIKTSTAP
ncbi:MAG: suppressor of fused domain protein [Saprospiraceae bacterium]|nr:suppressor of fused domain protein [Saprospiraceae bacterium]